MKLIVIQRHVENLTGIRECVAKINNKRAKKIIFTSDPNEVIDVVKDGKSTIVISGQILGGNYGYGTDLARDVKIVNKKAIFLMYSVMPEANEYVDGIIPKGWGTVKSYAHSLLARILCINLRKKVTLLRLKAEFPEIKVFEETERV